MGAADEARKRSADCAQVFISNPRGWAPPLITEDLASAFRQAWQASGLGPLIAHAPYLVNVASATPRFVEASVTLAIQTLDACEALGVNMLVVHAGTGSTDPHDVVVARAASSLRRIAEHGGPTRVLVELEEGIPAASASTIPDAERLFEEADVEELELCLDTCHLFATGYALDTEAGVAQLFDELHETGLSDRLALIHANDAMYERGSYRDRHENIGDGFIGLDGWRALLARPEVRKLALVLETPGDAARHARDIALLRSLAS